MFAAESVVCVSEFAGDFIPDIGVGVRGSFGAKEFVIVSGSVGFVVVKKGSVFACCTANAARGSVDMDVLCGNGFFAMANACVSGSTWCDEGLGGVGFCERARE